MSGSLALGSALVLAATLVFCRAYKRILESRLALTEEYLRFLQHIKQRISLNGEPYSSAVRSFDGRSLRETGFIAEIEEGAAPGEAFKRMRGIGCLSEKTRKVLEEGLGELGKGELPEEIKRIELCAEILSDIRSGEEAEKEKKVKTAYAVSLALALGSILLVI